LSPDERFVYVADLKDAVAIFARNPQWPTDAALRHRRLYLRDGGRRMRRGARNLRLPPGDDHPRRPLRLPGRQARREGGLHACRLLARPATGALRQLPGPAGCFTEDGSDGCAVGRVIQGAHAALLDAAERTLYLAADQFQGEIAVFRRNTSTGALAQLPGKFGCLSPIDWEGCTISRRMGGIHYLALSRDGRFLYAAGEKAQALVVLRVVSPVAFPPSSAP
jgi:hypothetical protein